MSEYEDSFSHSRTHVRSVRHRDEPKTPLWPGAIWPILGLLALTVFSCSHIQEQTEAAAERALSEAGLGNWANAEAHGRIVYLSGNAPDREQADKAVLVVQAAETGTWLGSKLVPAPTRVREDFVFPEISTDGADAGVQPADPASQEVSSPDWNFILSEGVLKLNGEVPDEDTRLAVVQIAQDSLAPPRLVAVEDYLNVRGTQAPPGYKLVAERGVRTVRECDRGVAAFENNRFSLNCQLPQGRVEAVRADAASSLPFGEPGAIEFQSHESVAACEDSLTSLLSNTQIRFATNSSSIDQSSAGLLKSIAEAAASCPASLRLRIEGHTDSTGSAEKNRILSASRAEAVRAALVQRGVSADRLVSRGYGADQPIADNGTSHGRAQNRRIEIKVIRPDE